MKSIVLLLLTSFTVSSAAWAQDCGDVNDKKDPFTEKTNRTAKVNFGNLMMKWTVEFGQTAGTTKMTWHIAMLGEYNQVIAEGTPMNFKLEDGTVLVLKTANSTSPVTSVYTPPKGSPSVSTRYNLDFILTREALASLGKSPITDIRIDVPGLRINYPKLKGKQAEKLSDIAGCLLGTF